MEKIKEAAAMAAIDNDIETFTEKYDQLVGERGITLSGGQKQRMSIARAWRKNSEVMIFDDSLSSVDSKTAKRIFENIRALNRAKTVIIVSHRIDVIKNSDIIFVLHNGTIAEQGAHDELVRQGGRYARLWELQNIEEHVGEHS